MRADGGGTGGCLFRPVGGPEADIVFKFILAFLVIWLGVGWLLEIPHMWSHRDPERPRRISCQANLRQIGYAVTMYCADNDGLVWPPLPPDRPFPTSLLSHLGNQQLLVCPSDRGGMNRPPGYTSYAVNGPLLGRPYMQVTGQPFVWDREPWHYNGRNVLPVDAKPKWMKEKDFLTITLQP